MPASCENIPDGLVLRRLENGDVPALIALESRCFSSVWREDQFLLALVQTAFFTLGLFEGTDLVAYISFYHHKGELEIVNIAVRQDYRRKGLGRCLLSEALRLGSGRGLERTVLEVRVSNAPAIALYEGLGFSLAGRRPEYYEDTGEDALVYEKIQEKL